MKKVSWVKILWPWVVLASLAGILVFSENQAIDQVGSSTPVNEEKDLVAVGRVIDGDTFDLASGDRVRLLGVDAPERGELHYETSRRALEELILDKRIQLVKDISHVDAYERLLRYVYVGDLFVNAALVRDGFARATPIPPDTFFAEEFFGFQKEAMLERRGIWGE